MIRRRMIGLSIAMFLAVLGFVGAGARAQAPTSATAVPKKAEEQFKNIQALKGIPAEQLMPSMQFIAASLGVQCDYCHVQGAFEKDDKKSKQTARSMMEMTFAINKEAFAGHREVTCYSCHRGSTVPVGTPVIDSGASVAAAAGKGQGEKREPGPTAEQLLEKYVRAAGGAAAIEKITTRVAEGSIEFGGKSFPIHIYSKDPDQRISFTHMGEGDSVTAFNGHEGWLSMPGRASRDMNPSESDGASIDADLHLAVHLQGMFSKVEIRGTEKVGDREAYVVVGQREGKPPIQLYFDEQSGLLLRLIRFTETALGDLPTQVDYADYRDADGVKVPFRWTLERVNGAFTIQASEIKQNLPVDDAKFAKPAAPAEERKAPGK